MITEQQDIVFGSQPFSLNPNSFIIVAIALTSPPAQKAALPGAPASELCLAAPEKGCQE